MRRVRLRERLGDGRNALIGQWKWGFSVFGWLGVLVFQCGVLGLKYKKKGWV